MPYTFLMTILNGTCFFCMANWPSWAQWAGSFTYQKTFLNIISSLHQITSLSLSFSITARNHMLPNQRIRLHCQCCFTCESSEMPVRCSWKGLESKELTQCFIMTMHVSPCPIWKLSFRNRVIWDSIYTPVFHWITFVELSSIVTAISVCLTALKPS